jgi:zinc and cadmium transporter
VPTAALILVFGLAMSIIALVGSLTLVLPERIFNRVVLPLVALAAGSLLGGTFFHLLPESVDQLGNGIGLYAGLVVGFLTFFILEQFLHWQHIHQPGKRREPVGYLILLADGLHNLIGGLAVGGAFIINTELGIVTWASWGISGSSSRAAGAAAPRSPTTSPRRSPSRWAV